VVFTLALAWLPADAPLLVLVDDTLARKGGKGVSLATMHHDPLLSTARRPFCSFGHVWVVLALWVPLPMGGTRGFALPLLFRLYVGAKRGGRADAPSRPRAGQRQRAAAAAHAAHPKPTKLELARELIGLVTQWAGGRTLYVVADSAYAARTVLERRPANVHVISRLRLDAALWARPGRRRPGQKGRPRRRGHRLPTPKAMAATRRRWDPLPLTLYGRQVSPLIFTCTALWYGALRDQPVRIVLVRDPAGRRKDEAFFCTDLTVSPAFLLEGYARRWTLEVSFHDQKQFLGFGDPQNQASQAVARTAPLAGIVYDLVLLWYAERVQQGRAPDWVTRPWYRSKTAPSFLDMLTAVRQESWRWDISAPPCSPRCPHNAPISSPDPGLAAA
jgi:Transposase DDE domain